MPTGTPSPITIRGKTYPSQAAAARALGTRRETVWQLVKAGRTEYIGLNHQKPVKALGRTFPSQQAFAKHLGVSSAAVSRGIKSHGSADAYARMRLARKRAKGA